MTVMKRLILSVLLICLLAACSTAPEELTEETTDIAEAALIGYDLLDDAEVAKLLTVAPHLEQEVVTAVARAKEEAAAGTLEPESSYTGCTARLQRVRGINWEDFSYRYQAKGLMNCPSRWTYGSVYAQIGSSYYGRTSWTSFRRSMNGYSYSSDSLDCVYGQFGAYVNRRYYYNSLSGC